MARIRRLNTRSLKQGVAHLASIDADLARAVAQCGLPPLRSAEPGFATLLRSIVGQQVSVHSARAIWDKLAVLVDPLTPENLLAAGEPVLRQAGFSGQKIRYGLALASDIVEGRVDLEALHEMEDESAIAELVKLKGIGRWTAEIYLMFALGRHDIMPGADLGLWVALQNLKGLRKRPDANKLLKVAEAWRPWRSVAALTLWHYRRNMPDWAKTEAKLALRTPKPVPIPDPISPAIRRKRKAA
jgi:DNA-3-methyladenine glycosylase II